MLFIKLYYSLLQQHSPVTHDPKPRPGNSTLEMLRQQLTTPSYTPPDSHHVPTPVYSAADNAGSRLPSPNYQVMARFLSKRYSFPCRRRGSEAGRLGKTSVKKRRYGG